MFFAAVRQYIIVNIDGRGSGGRGWKTRAPLYKNFGSPEIADQIDGLRLSIKKYPFMDPEKVAVIGWSYGGFASSHILAKDGGATIKCGIAIAPVVDFRFYGKLNNFLIILIEIPFRYRLYREIYVIARGKYQGLCCKFIFK